MEHVLSRIIPEITQQYPQFDGFFSVVTVDKQLFHVMEAMHRMVLLPHVHVLEAALNQGFTLTLKYQPQNRPDVNANDLFFCTIAIQSMQQEVISNNSN